MLINAVKWISIPALLIASLFSFYAPSYAQTLDCSACIGAIAFGQRALRLKEYFWGAGLLAVAIAFSPLALALKLFLLLGLSCVTAFAALIAAFRAQPAPVV